MPYRYANIERARAVRKEAKDALEWVFLREIPPGCSVVYRHGAHNIVVEVLEHQSFAERCKVRSRTGKEYWLDWSRITGIV